MNSTFMKDLQIFDNLFERYPILDKCKNSIMKAYEILTYSYDAGGTLYVAGNGGSAADSEHIVGELMKSFMAKRPINEELSKKLYKVCPDDANLLNANIEGGLPAVSLPSFCALSTAVSNDVNGDFIFAQALNSVSKANDVFLGISTSGNSKNIVYAMEIAKAKGLKCIGLCGAKECKLDSLCDVSIHVPETETYKIQELHLPIYHALCAMLESHYWGE